MNLEFEDAAQKRKLAMGYAEQAAALNGMDSLCNWAIGETAFQLAQYDRSRTHMARAISLNPNDAATERNPASPQWHNWVRGITLFLVGKPEEAIAAFEFFGRPNPAMLKWRTIALVKLGRLDEARADMRSILAIKPTLTAATARTVLDYLPDVDAYVAALRQAGLPD
jgi:Flp pilus assembly protein TadD